MNFNNVRKQIGDNRCRLLSLGVILWLAAKWLIIEPNLSKEKMFDIWVVPHLFFGFVSGICCGFPFQFFLLIFWEIGEYVIDPNLWLLSWDNNLFDIIIGVVGLLLAKIYKNFFCVIPSQRQPP